MKVWEKSEIRNILLGSNRAVEKGITAIFERQTNDEQYAETARHANNIGFSAAHASRGSYYAKWVNGGKSLTGIHVVEGRKLILHYVRQLAEIANDNEARNEYEAEIGKADMEAEMRNERSFEETPATIANHELQAQMEAEAGIY